MRLILFFICLFLSFSLFGSTTPVDVIFSGRAGTALNSLTIYSDSSFTKPTFSNFSAGTLLDILDETDLEHEDDAQNQTFKWYKVKSTTGKEGWVFGDGLAVIIPEARLDKAFLSSYKKRMKFNNGFEQSVVWMAAIEGHDNFHANALLNPLYFEGYIVITNHRGKSVHIHYGGESTQGVSLVKELQFQELTGDTAPELIMLRMQEGLRSKTPLHTFELYSFQSGTIRKVFEERLDFPDQEESISKCTNKFLELDRNTIRVEYLQSKSCDQYTLPLRTGIGGTSSEQCLELVTYTYHWNISQKKYQILYDANHSAPQAKSKKPGVFLQQSPAQEAARIRSIHPDEYLDVIRQQDSWVTERGKQFKVSYFYVRLRDGIYGYVPAQLTRFTNAVIESQWRQLHQLNDHQEISYFHIRNTKADSSAFHQK